MFSKCYEVEQLEDFLKEHGLNIYSELGEEEYVLIRCQNCQEVHELRLEGYGK